MGHIHCTDMPCRLTPLPCELLSRLAIHALQSVHDATDQGKPIDSIPPREGEPRSAIDGVVAATVWWKLMVLKAGLWPRKVYEVEKMRRMLVISCKRMNEAMVQSKLSEEGVTWKEVEKDEKRFVVFLIKGRNYGEVRVVVVEKIEIMWGSFMKGSDLARVEKEIRNLMEVTEEVETRDDSENFMCWAGKVVNLRNAMAAITNFGGMVHGWKSTLDQWLRIMNAWVEVLCEGELVVAVKPACYKLCAVLPPRSVHKSLDDEGCISACELANNASTCVGAMVLVGLRNVWPATHNVGFLDREFGGDADSIASRLERFFCVGLGLPQEDLRPCFASLVQRVRDGGPATTMRQVWEAHLKDSFKGTFSVMNLIPGLLHVDKFV